MSGISILDTSCPVDDAALRLSANPGGLLRRSRWLTGVALTSALLGFAAPAMAVTEPHHAHFGGGPGGVTNGPEESGSDDAFAASQWFVGQRAAPNATVNVHAYAALQGAAASVPATSGAWTERTTGDYFTDGSG